MSLSLFDLDRTLLNVNSSFQFGIYLYKKKKLSSLGAFHHSICYAGYVLRLLTITQVQHRIFQRLFLGASLPEFNSLALDFVERCFHQILYDPAVEQLCRAQQEGHMTIILSSSPDFLVEAFAKKFGVDAWSGSQYLLNDQQQFTTTGPGMLGQDKRSYLEEVAERFHIPKSSITAYSDSIDDLPFLQAAGHAVAVNPDPQLRRMAKKLGWCVI